MLLIERGKGSLRIADTSHRPALAQKGADLADDKIIDLPGIYWDGVGLVIEDGESNFPQGEPIADRRNDSDAFSVVDGTRLGRCRRRFRLGWLLSDGGTGDHGGE